MTDDDDPGDRGDPKDREGPDERGNLDGRGAPDDHGDPDDTGNPDDHGDPVIRPGPRERPGLHSERTLLAWIRTGTALAAGGLGAAGVAGRHTGDGRAAVPFVLAALCGALLLARTRVRYRRVERAATEGLPLDAGADALLAWLGVLAVVSGAVAFVLVSA
ncbi:DUF202 domain-containing protein [Sphaerisporangium sp. NPDC004334]